METSQFRRLALFAAVQLVLVAGVIGWIWDFTAWRREPARKPVARKTVVAPPLVHTLSGRLLTPEGAPVAGADIQFGAKDRYLSLHYRYAGKPKEPFLSDAEGRFTMNVPEGPLTLFAEHDLGYAAGSVETGGFGDVTLTLQPWGKVEVTVRHGSTPIAGLEVELSLDDLDKATEFIRYYKQATTNEKGVAMLKRVPAGFGSVDLRKWGGDDSTLRVEGALRTHAGETVVCAVGGTGRRVTGTLTNARGFLPAPVSEVDGVIRKRIVRTRAPEGLDEAGKKAWFEAWKKTPEYWMEQNAHRMYCFKLQRDGRFVLDDIPPGTYTLELSRYGPPEPETGFLYPVESYKTTFVVAGTNDATDQEVAALGVMRLAKVTASAGKMATDFAFTTLDGEAHKISDFRGKYVLLDFWGVFCPPCREAIPALRALHEKYAPRGKFVLIGLSADLEEATLREFLAKEPMPWMQVHLGSQSIQMLDDIHGVHGYPTGILIDPAGMIVAGDLRGDALLAAVNRALGAE